MIETSSEIWNKIFESEDVSLLAETWNQNPLWKLYKRLLDPIKKEIIGKKAVELGSGTGKSSLGLALEYGMHVTLVDFSDAALKVSRALYESAGVKDVEYLKMNILDFDKTGFALSHSQGVVEHFSPHDRREIIRKHADSLELGGHSLIITPNRLNFLYSLGKLVAENSGKWEYGYENPVTIKTLSREMMDSGLRLIDSSGEGLIAPAWTLLSLNKRVRNAVMRSAQARALRLRPIKRKTKNERRRIHINMLLPFIGGRVAVLGRK